MSMINNEIDTRGIRWVRCDKCGDSKKPWKAHCAIYPDGGSYCFRCAHFEELELSDLVDLMLQNSELVQQSLEKNSVSIRNSVSNYFWSRAKILPQYKIDNSPDWVSFEMRDINGQRTGWHNRNMIRKVCDNEGRRGIGFYGDSLVSSMSSPLIIVEGPADVISTRHVCVFGAISKNSLKFFRLQYVWFHPDPDQIDTELKLYKFIEKIIKPAQDDYMINVQGLIVGNDDPDKATILKHIPLKELV